MIEGYVDHVGLNAVVGWIFDRSLGRSSDVVASLHGRELGSGPANLYRADLENAGLGDGRCGFKITFPESISEIDLPFVTVKPRGSSLTLARTSTVAFVDFVQAHLAQYPMAGRSRSIYGGLWTDRTDALSLLVSKVAIGQCDQRLEASLRALITNGLLKIGRYGDVEADHENDRQPTSEGGEAASLLNGAVEGIITDHLASLMKSIFEDHPIVYKLESIENGETSYRQSSSFEEMTSPAEMLCVYILNSGAYAELQYIVDSHHFPEFGSSGSSRWVSEGKGETQETIAALRAPIGSAEIGKDDVAIAGPGLIHRISLGAGASAIRMVFAPKRTCPVRFLLHSEHWTERDIGHGVRSRYSRADAV